MTTAIRYRIERLGIKHAASLSVTRCRLALVNAHRQTVRLFAHGIAMIVLLAGCVYVGVPLTWDPYAHCTSACALAMRDV